MSHLPACLPSDRIPGKCYYVPQNFLIFLHFLSISVYVSYCMCRCLHRSEEGVEFPQLEFIDWVYWEPL